MINRVQVSNSESYKRNSAQKKADGSFDAILKSKVKNKSMDEMFKEAAKKYNVPENLLRAVAQTESDFDPKAVSGCGAVGVMQLMPGTAKDLGVSDPYDAEQNINGGAKYISSLLKKYGGDVDLALAAYNAGPGNVEKYGGVPPFKETQNYVRKIRGILGEGSSAVQNLKATETAAAASVDTGSASGLSDADVKKYLSYIQLNMLSVLQNSLDSQGSDKEYLL